MAWQLLASAAMAAGSPPLEAPAQRGGPITITMPVGHESLAPSAEQGVILTLQPERYDRFRSLFSLVSGGIGDALGTLKAKGQWAQVPTS